MKRYFVDNAEKEVETYIESCCVCLERKKMSDQARLQPIIVQGLLEKIGIDVVRPIRRFMRGNKYMIPAIEHASKYVITKAIPRPMSRSASESTVEKPEEEERATVTYFKLLSALPRINVQRFIGACVRASDELVGELDGAHRARIS
ncbi:hypothetical protein EVAR_95062_1 [Eumeta japonica]|uniref:Uncharacterized protein n=1 Tax=Eumeta variegata TaxID=151549 RepID=A0A4C1W6S2_EUMVA|nr:hypothetical protein EVAR_95062_1 [Eumeta japonica]